MSDTRRWIYATLAWPVIIAATLSGQNQKTSNTGPAISPDGKELAFQVGLKGSARIAADQNPPGGTKALVASLEQQIAGREKQPAESVFKNIQVFKGMPAIRVLRIMDQAFVPNLGVECTHCHVADDWANDSKPAKNIARAMWTLRADVQAQVRKATGKENAVVTCYTCHKGLPVPAFQPAQ